jgi:hypothetical protein
LGGWINELHQVKHRGIGIISKPHEHPSDLVGLDPETITDARILCRKVVDLVKPQLLVEAD